MVLATSTFFVACNEDEGYVERTKKSSLMLSANFLSFKDFADVETTIATLEEYDENTIKDWEKTNNFVSLQTIYDRIMEQEEKYCDSLETIYTSIEDVQKLENIHSDIFNKYSDILIERKFSDGGVYYDLDISNSDYARIVNKDGIVKIGNDIYQFKDGVTKIIEGGDVSKIDILDDIDSTDEDLGIKVNKDVKLIYTKNTFRKSETNNIGKYRVILYHDFLQNYIFNFTEVCTVQHSRVRSLKKRLFGLYYIDHRTKITINSSFVGSTVTGYTIAVFGGYPTYETRTWGYTGTKIYKKNTTADYYYFNSYLFPFFSQDQPVVNNGSINVKTEEGINMTITIP